MYGPVMPVTVTARKVEKGIVLYRLKDSAGARVQSSGLGASDWIEEDNLREV